MIKKGTKMSTAGSIPPQTECPVARAQNIIGDRSTVLVLRELFMGNNRFESIQAQAQTTPQMLSSRLKKLEADGLIERRPYNARPLRHEYFLTEKGLAFYPVLLALRSWGETFLKSEKEEVAIHFTHLPCGHDPGLGPTCQRCGGEMSRDQLVSTMSNAFAEERKSNQENFKIVRS